MRSILKTKQTKSALLKRGKKRSSSKGKNQEKFSLKRLLFGKEKPGLYPGRWDIEEFYARQQEAALNRAKTGHQDSQLNDFIERCSTGEIMPYNYWEYIPSRLYSPNASQFKNAWSMYHDARIAKAKGNRDCQIIWLYGEKGTGKTSLGKLYAQQMELPLYITHPGNDPMGSYLDQPIILLDELRPKEGFTYKELLQFLDPYTQTATKSRYFDKIAMADWDKVNIARVGNNPGPLLLSI